MQVRKDIVALVSIWLCGSVVAIPAACAYDQKLWDYINNNSHVSQKVVDGMRAHGQVQHRQSVAQRSQPKPVAVAKVAPPATARTAKKTPALATTYKPMRSGRYTVSSRYRSRYGSRTVASASTNSHKQKSRYKKRSVIARFFSALKHIF